MVDQNTKIAAQFHVTLTQAIAMNDTGQILCNGVFVLLLFVSYPHMFLLTPTNLLRIRDFGILGGTTSQAYGINMQGQVVGSSTLADGTTHGFLWNNNGTMADLGLLTGGTSSVAYGISDD